MDKLTELREALIACGRAAGAGLSDNVSDEFLMWVPGEVKAKIERLQSRTTDAELERLTRENERLTQMLRPYLKQEEVIRAAREQMRREIAEERGSLTEDKR